MSKELTSASEFEALIEASDKKPVFLKCYMNGCPHCVHMAEDWEKMAKKVKHDKLNVEVAAIEQGVISSIASKHADIVKVDGFPTLLCIKAKGSKVSKHDGERTEEALYDFIKKETSGAQTGGRKHKTRRTHSRRNRVVTHRRRKLHRRTKRRV